MSQGNVEVARQCFEAWSRWVLEDIAACYSADAQIISPGSEMFGRTYSGHAGLRLYIEDFIAVFEPPVFELEEILDAGERVVSVVRVRARGRQSGAQVRTRTANIFTVRQRLIRRQVIYMDRSEALEAVGLRE